jgi:predicted NACHT family NTPase
MNRFDKINFKYTDAEEEKLYAPELIDQAYVDINCILEEIEKPEKFLVIGPKGSGKTALSSKLQLMEKNRWNLFVETDELEQFEYS